MMTRSYLWEEGFILHKVTFYHGVKDMAGGAKPVHTQ